MSELKVRFIDDTYAEYYNTGKHDLAQVYIKAEADKKLRHHKHKRCLAMALLCFTKGKEKQSVYKLRTFFWGRWGNRWLKLAEKLKEAK